MKFILHMQKVSDPGVCTYYTVLFVFSELVVNCFCHTDVETGVTHQFRAWFERAVSSDSAKRCALVWRLYMFFEVCVVSIISFDK